MTDSFDLDMEDDPLTLTMLESILCDQDDLVLGDRLDEAFDDEDDVVVDVPTTEEDGAPAPPPPPPQEKMMEEETSEEEKARKAEAARKRSARAKKKAEKEELKKTRGESSSSKEEDVASSFPPLRTNVVVKAEKDEEKEKSSSESEEKNMTEEERKEEKKQRRLIRNRMSAQLHRERKKAYVDHLEGLVKERDETIAQLRAENAKLRAALDEGARPVSESDSLSAAEETLSSYGSDEESSTRQTKKRARTSSMSRAATALLAAVSCVALFSSGNTRLSANKSPVHPTSEDAPDAPTPMTSYAVVPSSPRRHLLSSEALLREDKDDDDEPQRQQQKLALLPESERMLPAALHRSPSLPQSTPPPPIGYERDVTRELFSYPLLENHTAAANVTRSLLRGSRKDVAPYRQTSGGTSYVVCSKAAGVFANGNDAPHSALLSLPGGNQQAPGGFVQMLVPLPDLDASAWGYDPNANDNDLWLELGAHLAYGRLVRNVKFTTSF
eukprot:CAMPEP_0198644802 /NCGR_PEP_ID=MMETSP1467-20131203/855_1 /TAXON_ID=1462469 /ORGANISM="unid. sp., Strain CCMP2135" /LENGTH=498 /DNA_ID=CAMNT_0044380269 /DNA_START=25 /DNA_END=1521 /DNA_ORIENTATION=+